MRRINTLFGALFLAVLLAGLLVAGTASGMSTGAFAVFTHTGVAATLIGSGTVKMSWNSEGTSSLTTTVGPLSPGDSVQTVSDLINSGDTELSTIQIAVVGVDTGPVSDGLQLAIDSCSLPWTGANGEFTCEGAGQGIRVVSADRPVTGMISLFSSRALTFGGTDHLRFTYRLADYAPVSMENSSGTVTVVATGIQRAGHTS